MAQGDRPRDLRKEVVETASAMFVESGYDGISMREIAQALGVSKAALYYHFADKQALMVSILEQYLAEIEAALDNSLPEDGDFRAHVAGLVRAIFSLPPGRRAVVRLASQEMGKLEPSARARFGEMYHRRFIRRIERIMEQGAARGELRTMSASAATWILLGMMYPFFYGGAGSSGGTADPPVEQIVSVFLDGAAVSDSSRPQGPVAEST